MESKIINEWREQARIAGLVEGEIKKCQAHVLRILSSRFGSVSTSLRRRVEETKDINVLDQWFELALEVQSLEEFQHKLLK